MGPTPRFTPATTEPEPKENTMPSTRPQGTEPAILRGLPRRPSPESLRRRLSAADVERLAGMDATNAVTRGRLDHMLRRSTDPTDPARPLVMALLDVPVRPAAPAAPANPARLRPVPGSNAKRPLTAVDLELIRRLPTDPAQVSAEDVTTLAAMVAQAASASDLRLLRSVFEPAWNHHDTLEQQEGRRQRLDVARASLAARTPAVEQAAITALAASIEGSNPELRPHEARARATEQLRERWAAVDGELQATIQEASSSEAPTPRPMPGIEGLRELATARERAQLERTAREATASSLDGLGKLAGG